MAIPIPTVVVVVMLGSLIALAVAIIVLSAEFAKLETRIDRIAVSDLSAGQEKGEENEQK